MLCGVMVEKRQLVLRVSKHLQPRPLEDVARKAMAQLIGTVSPDSTTTHAMNGKRLGRRAFGTRGGTSVTSSAASWRAREVRPISAMSAAL